MSEPEKTLEEQVKEFLAAVDKYWPEDASTNIFAGDPDSDDENDGRGRD